MRGWGAGGLFPSLTLRMGFHPSANPARRDPPLVFKQPPGVQKWRPSGFRGAASARGTQGCMLRVLLLPPVIHEKEKRLSVFSVYRVDLTFCLFLFLPPRRPTLRKTWTSPADQVNEQTVVLLTRRCFPFARGDPKKQREGKGRNPKKDGELRKN